MNTKLVDVGSGVATGEGGYSYPPLLKSGGDVGRYPPDSRMKS